jgi:hypothetical protein
MPPSLEFDGDMPPVPIAVAAAVLNVPPSAGAPAIAAVPPVFAVPPLSAAEPAWPSRGEVVIPPVAAIPPLGGAPPVLTNPPPPVELS